MNECNYIENVLIAFSEHDDNLRDLIRVTLMITTLNESYVSEVDMRDVSSRGIIQQDGLNTRNGQINEIKC